jgi:hypothetical protein
MKFFTETDIKNVLRVWNECISFNSYYSYSLNGNVLLEDNGELNDLYNTYLSKIETIERINGILINNKQLPIDFTDLDKTIEEEGTDENIEFYVSNYVCIEFRDLSRLTYDCDPDDGYILDEFIDFPNLQREPSPFESEHCLASIAKELDLHFDDSGLIETFKGFDKVDLLQFLYNLDTDNTTFDEVECEEYPDFEDCLFMGYRFFKDNEVVAFLGLTEEQEWVAYDTISEVYAKLLNENPKFVGEFSTDPLTFANLLEMINKEG